MHGDALGHPNPDGRNLVEVGHVDVVVAPNPHSTASVDPLARNTEFFQQLDQKGLESSHVCHNIDGVGESDDGIAHQLPGSVPRNLAAAIDVDDLGAVCWALVRLGTFAGRVNAGVFEEKQGVGHPPGDNILVNASLKLPRVAIVHRGGVESKDLHVQHVSSLRPSPTHLAMAHPVHHFKPTHRGHRTLGHHGDVHEASLPSSVGGYRVGRRLAQGRFLGHALAPSLVELVFLNELTGEQQRRVCSEAQDFASLPDGSRVAILERTSRPDEFSGLDSPVHVRLTTPPDLVESWRHMEEATAATSTAPPTSPRDSETLLARVSGLLRRARRGPLVLAVLAGVVAVVAVATLLPGAPASTEPGTVSGTGSPMVSTSESNPLESQPSNPLSTPSPVSTSDPTPSLSGLSNAAPPLEPLSELGDFILVRVPAKSGQGSGEIAVLERAADSWVVRETYPETGSLP